MKNNESNGLWHVDYRNVFQLFQICTSNLSFKKVNRKTQICNKEREREIEAGRDGRQKRKTVSVKEGE